MELSLRRALLSTWDTDGVADFARALKDMGFEVVAATGTYEYLRDEGVDVTSVEQMIGSAVAVGGSVETVHPRLTEAVLWGSDYAAHGEGSAPNGNGNGASAGAGFDLVAVNLQPFERTASRRDMREDDIVAAIDIDGPAVLRSAARNFERVLVVTDPDVYPIVLDELRDTNMSPSYQLRRLLASRAFDASAHYELSIASWFSEVEDFPTYMLRDYVKMMDLPFGENPHQRAAYYVEVGARRHLLSMVEQISGSDLAYTNLLDLNTARWSIGDFTIPACVIVKHGAPSGVAASGSIAAAFERALAADAGSAQGGVVAVNRPVDADLARAMSKHYFEVLFAPDFTEEARDVLAGASDDLRVLLDRERRKRSPGEREMRRVIGGLLVQDPDTDLEERDFMDVVTEAQPSEKQWGDMLFAWRVAKWVPSNAAVLARDLETVGIGGTTPSRLDSIEFALKKAGDRASGAMLATDAFFGYADGPQLAVDAGIAGIIQPGGSNNDQEIIDLCNNAGIPMVFTHRRHFRH